MFQSVVKWLYLVTSIIDSNYILHLASLRDNILNGREKCLK